ncbi:hypothetical protein PUN28_007710 [Cardiocondyla obscurior]
MSDQSRNDIDRLAKVINNLQKALNCTICEELMKEPTKTRCGHSFCKTCIGRILQRKSAHCPICKTSLNKRKISKDDHLQICIEKFNVLVAAIEFDSHIVILPHSTRTQTDNLSASHNLEIEALSNSFDDDMLHSSTDIKIRTWLHSFPDNPTAEENEMPIKDDKARPTNPISDESDEVQQDSISASRRPRQDRKRSTDCPKRIDEDGAGSQVGKETSQIGEVIEIDSGLKYKTIHAKVRMKNQREKIVRSNPATAPSQDNLSSTAAVHDQIASLNVPVASTSAEQSTSNWSRVMNVGKEMKRAKKRKVKKLHVSTEKSKTSPKIINDILLTPNSKYNSNAIRMLDNKKKSDISTHLEFSDKKENAIDKSLNLSDKSIKSFNETNHLKLHNKNLSNSTKSLLNDSYITLEEGRKIRIINLNNDEMNKIIGFGSNAENLECSENIRCKENDSNALLQERLSGLTPKKLNESVQKITCDVSRTSADNFSSSCLSTEKRSVKSRESSNVQRTPDKATSSLNKSRLSLRKKSELNNCDSPPLSDIPLSCRQIKKTDINSTSNSTRSESIPNRSYVKFLQLGTLVKRHNVKYLFLGTTKRERSMLANVQISSVYNMQQLFNKPDMRTEIFFDQWRDSQNSNKITMVENNSSANNTDKRPIHGTNARTCSETSNAIKLLSPDKDSQLKFLTIDSPVNEREKVKCAGPIKSAIKGNNFSEMESSRFAESTMGCTRKPSVESPCKKRKRTKCTGNRELFEDGSNDGNDSNHSDSSQSTLKLDAYNEMEASLDAKKSRLYFADDQNVSSSSLEEQGAFEKIPKMSRSDTKPKSTHIKKKLKSSQSDNQCTRRNVSTVETKKHRIRPDDFELNDANCLDEDQRIPNTVDKWSSKRDKTQNKLTKGSKNTQNSGKSVGNPSEENSEGHQSSSASNALEMKTDKSVKSNQKSCTKESYNFESSSLFNSENIDYIMQQSLKTDVTSKKIMEPTNDDIINRVLEIDQMRNNFGTSQPLNSSLQNPRANQREKDNEKDLLQDNFDDIIASVEQPQSDEIIVCTESSARNLNRPVAKQKTSNYLAMTDEPIVQQTPIISLSSTNDMFEDQSSKNIKKPSMNTTSKTRAKKNVASDQKKHVDSRERKESLTECNISIESVNQLQVDDDEMRKPKTTGNISNAKDDTSELDSTMNITQHQIELQMFEKDLFGVPAQNQTKVTKIISQDDPSLKQQSTPKKRKQNSSNKNTRPGEHSADEDDVVENTPEKKTKKCVNAKAIELKNIVKIEPSWPVTPSTSRPCEINLSSLETPTANMFRMCPSAQSTPIAYSSIVTKNRSDIFKKTKSERIESRNILLARQMNTKTPENVAHQFNKRDLCFACSGLSEAQINVVKKLVTIYNANYVSQFNRNVTHVIMKTTGEENVVETTLKCLQGIAHRKWIVSFRWVEDCIKQQKLLNELPYEVTTLSDIGINTGPRNSRLREKDLFEGFTFLCVGPYNNVSLSEYQDMLVATGARVVESFDIFAKLEGMKGVVIQDDVHDEKEIEHWYRTAKAAPISAEWIVQCIIHYKVFNITPYMLSSKDYYAIGYPRDIVDEEESYYDV